MDVAVIETDAVSTRFDQAEESGLCPECGATMNEIDRLREGPWTFIWLGCARADCSGQWLQKKPCSDFGRP
jgi:hypothetical protein